MGPAIKTVLAVDACHAPGGHVGAVAGDDDDKEEGGGAMEQPPETNNGTIVGGGLGTQGGLMAGGCDAGCNNQPNERGATRGRGVMRGGGKAKAPDNVTQRDTTTNEWRGVKRGGGAG